MEDWGRRCENLGGRQTAVQRRESRPSKPLPHHQRIANTARTFSWYIQTSAAAVTHFYKIARNVQPECSIIGFYHTYLLYIQKLYPVHESNFCAIKAWYKRIHQKDMKIELYVFAYFSMVIAITHYQAKQFLLSCHSVQRINNKEKGFGIWSYVLLPHPDVCFSPSNSQREM